jgi:8-oxo-dGTP pyrophosphatase MutT (NUDIX family)
VTTRGSQPVHVRTAARVIVLDKADRLLLLAARDPADGRVVWFTPGGGVEPGESLPQAAQRELAEEVPLAGPLRLQGPVWRRRHVFSWNGRQIDQTEWYFVARLEGSIDPADIHVGGPEEAFYVGARWASVAELADADDIVAPRRLAELLPPIIAGDYPPAPIDTGA